MRFVPSSAARCSRPAPRSRRRHRPAGASAARSRGRCRRRPPNTRAARPRSAPVRDTKSTGAVRDRALGALLAHRPQRLDAAASPAHYTIEQAANGEHARRLYREQDRQDRRGGEVRALRHRRPSPTARANKLPGGRRHHRLHPCRRRIMTVQLAAVLLDQGVLEAPASVTKPRARSPPTAPRNTSAPQTPRIAALYGPPWSRDGHACGRRARTRSRSRCDFRYRPVDRRGKPIAGKTDTDRTLEGDRVLCAAAPDAAGHLRPHGLEAHPARRSAASAASRPSDEARRSVGAVSLHAAPRVKHAARKRARCRSGASGASNTCCAPTRSGSARPPRPSRTSAAAADRPG